MGDNGPLLVRSVTAARPHRSTVGLNGKKAAKNKNLRNIVKLMSHDSKSGVKARGAINLGG